MKRATIFITQPLPDAGARLLRRWHRVQIRRTSSSIPRRELLRGVRSADALLPDLTDRVDAAVMDAAPRLRVIANYAVGVDNIDVAAATQRGIVVTNTPGVLDDAVAEHALALTLAVTRRIVEADRFTRAGKYKGWMPMGFMGPSLLGKTIGIVGAGHIGSTLTRMAHDGLGMKVVYTDVHRNTLLERSVRARFLSLTQLLRVADVVSLHVPLLPSTRHLISTAQLRLMKQSAVLINTSRGPVVDERALVCALKQRRIGGAGLDVFECEPLIDCDSRDGLSLADFDTVVLTPHIASATIEARNAMAVLAAQNILDVLRGKRPKAFVNSDVWKHRKNVP